ncbi:MAG: DUF3553 domain-containing protein [Phycisphaerae bacterium]|nr:DUF3553 domain-containing protein [Phycisphaerae bacterium]
MPQAMPGKQWSFGDRVIHATKPEWGVGVITAAQNTNENGQSCQRLTIRFEREGIKTVTTAVAELRDAAELPTLSAQERQSSDDVLSTSIEGPTAKELLTRLPEACTDPFLSPTDRVKNTLALYRFSDHGGSLLDWAAAQTGLKDPLSRLNRHELEAVFRSFAQVRDEHLKRVVLELKKKSPGVLPVIARQATPAAQQALRRVDGGR